MPVLRNIRHELFAAGVAKHGNASQAAIEAGYGPKGAAVRGSELLKRADVAQRVKELEAVKDKASAKAVERSVLTRQWVIDRLMENAENALASNDRGAANRALELLGREVGAFIERKQVEVFDPLAGLDARRLQALLDDLETYQATGQHSSLIDVSPNSEISETPAISTTYAEIVPEAGPEAAADEAPGAGGGGAGGPPGRRATGAGWSEAGTGSLDGPPPPNPLPTGSSIPAVPPEPDEEEI